MYIPRSLHDELLISRARLFPSHSCSTLLHVSPARWLKPGTSKSTCTCSTSTYSTTVHVQVPQLYCIFDCLFLTLYFWLFFFWLFIFDRDSTLKSPSPCLKIWVWRAVFGCWRPRWIAVWHRARRAQLHENKFSYDCTYVPCLSHLASYSTCTRKWYM